jgi:hypothetical protein
VKLAVAVLSLFASGCSLVLVKGPPKPVPAQGPITCSTAAGGPAFADGLIGTVTGGLVAFFAYAVSRLGTHGQAPEERDEVSVGGALMYGLLFASPWYLSAYAGVSRASDCREVKSETGR